jgi:hypothetical protein
MQLLFNHYFLIWGIPLLFLAFRLGLCQIFHYSELHDLADHRIGNQLIQGYFTAPFARSYFDNTFWNF